MSEDTNQNKQPEMRWYTLHVYSTMEKSVAKAIQDRIDHSDLKQYFGEVLLPIEKVQENRNGRKYESERRMYPGYVFVEMVMNEDTWHLMNSTPRVIEFLGNNNPVPLSQREIDGIKGRMNVGTGEKARPKVLFEVGETVKVGYADQTHKDIDPKKTVYQVVSGGQEFIRVGGKEVNSRAYLSKFNFAGADQEKLCGVLSGGERNRLHLALTLKAEANVLLLDEPTNDIDVNTLRALEEGLENFAGCAVVVSHDRWFLDRICTHILSFEGDSNVVFYEGSYSEYEEYKRKLLGDVEPKRVRYRKLIVD